MKRLLVILLCISMIFSAAVLPAAAHDVSDEKAETGWSLLTEAQFQTKMAQMRSKYPNGSIWSGEYYEDGMVKAWTCWAYSAQMLNEFFGVKFYADGMMNYKYYDTSGICAGDWVRIDWDSHSIFITKVTDSGVWFTDGNGTGVYNQVRWDGFYSWSEINSRFSYRLHLPGNNLKGTAPEDIVYTIDYNSNGGTGSMSSEKLKANSKFTLKSNSFEREDYTFDYYTVRRSYDGTWYTNEAGWQPYTEIVENDYTFKTYPEGNTYTLGTPWIGGVYGSCSFTFYAEWSPLYTIAYGGNGGDGDMSSETLRYGDGFTLGDNGFTYDGYTFGGYTVFRSYDYKWYTNEAGWQSLTDIYDNGYTYKVYPEGGSYRVGTPWLGSISEPCSFIFFAEWIPDDASVEFFDNYSGYNYLLGSDLGSDYSDYIYSRDPSVYSVSVDRGETLNNNPSLKIVGKSAGESGYDLAMVTSTNIGWGNGYSQLCDVGEDEDFYLRFYAKSTVDNAKMYVRWGFGSTYQSVTLTKEWKLYNILIPKNRFLGATLHPYFDKRGTFYINSPVLGFSGTSNVVPESGRWAASTRTVDLGGTISDMPVPKRDGYTFLGWYTDAEGGSRVTEDTPITQSHIRLYAHWSKDISFEPEQVYSSNGHVYEVYNNTMGWEEAEQFCEDKGGHLITLDSYYENQLTRDKIKDKQGYCWIGLSYNTSKKEWEWVNGEPFFYRHWYLPTYESEDTGEYYAMMYPMNIGNTPYFGTWDKCVGSGYYRSYYGYHNSFFICEYDKLKYRGDADGSGIVDIVDAAEIQRSLLGLWVPIADHILMHGDVDDSGSLEVTDATFIQRYCTNVETPYAIGSLM